MLKILQRIDPGMLGSCIGLSLGVSFCLLASLVDSPVKSQDAPKPARSAAMAELKAGIGAGSNATITGVTVPPSVAAGASFTATVTVSNTGPDAWTSAAGYKLGAIKNINTWSVPNGRVELAGNVAPGQSATFTVNAVAPQTSGPTPFQFQMLQENVVWFGGITAATINVTGGTAPPNPGNGFIQDANLTAGLISLPPPGDISGNTILITPAVAVDKSIHQVHWKNTLSVPIKVFKAKAWSGIGKGVTCDCDVQFVRDRDQMPIVHNQTDHYNEMAGPAANNITENFSTPFVLQPGEGITGTYFANPITGGGMHQHSLKIWFTN